MQSEFNFADSKKKNKQNKEKKKYKNAKCHNSIPGHSEKNFEWKQRLSSFLLIRIKINNTYFINIRLYSSHQWMG